MNSLSALEWIARSIFVSVVSAVCLCSRLKMRWGQCHWDGNHQWLVECSKQSLGAEVTFLDHSRNIDSVIWRLIVVATVNTLHCWRKWSHLLLIRARQLASVSCCSRRQRRCRSLWIILYLWQKSSICRQFSFCWLLFCNKCYSQTCQKRWYCSQCKRALHDWQLPRRSSGFPVSSSLRSLVNCLLIILSKPWP